MVVTSINVRKSALYLDMTFLDLARAAASTVVRILDTNLQFEGNGFMVSERLLLTNNHVLYDSIDANRYLIEFNCELNAVRMPRAVTRFHLAPDVFFMSSAEQDLDFSIAAVGNRISGRGELSDFGYCQLREVNREPQLGEMVNIIQHPGDDFKKIVFRESKLIAKTDEVIHYYADTKSGSSGSPVFDDDFVLLGIHHYGKISRKAYTADGKHSPKNVKEGIRISAIVERMKSEKSHLNMEQSKLVDEALNCNSHRQSH